MKILNTVIYTVVVRGMREERRAWFHRRYKLTITGAARMVRALYDCSSAEFLRDIVVVRVETKI